MLLLYALSLLIITAFIALMCDYARGIPPWPKKNISTSIPSNPSLNDTVHNLSPQPTEDPTSIVWKQQEETALPTLADVGKMQSAYTQELSTSPRSAGSNSTAPLHGMNGN